MKSATLAINRQQNDTGESVVILDRAEVGIILDSLEAYSEAHPRSKKAKTLVSEFEALPSIDPNERRIRIKIARDKMISMMKEHQK